MNYFNYFSEIEETFIRRRGRNLLLSPLDWALIEDWQERRIPLWLVLRAINKVFDSYDQNPNKRRTIKSLTYCKEEIEVQYSEWLESQVGKNGKSGVPSSKSQVSSFDSENLSYEAIAEHLERITKELKTAERKTSGDLRKMLERVLQRLAEMKETKTEAKKLEETLEKMDDAIDKILLESYASKNLKAEVQKQIASYQNKMEPEAFQKTFDLMLIKNLREQAEIPRLSLFYL